MIAAVLHVLAIGVLGVLVRRLLATAPAHMWLAAAVAGAVVGAILAPPTQARVRETPDMVAAAGPAGLFTTAVLVAAAVVLALPTVRRWMARNGATPLECCAANDLNHRS